MDRVKVYIVAGPNQGKTTIAHIIKDALEGHGFKKVSLEDLKPSATEIKMPIEQRMKATKERAVVIEVVSTPSEGKIEELKAITG